MDVRRHIWKKFHVKQKDTVPFVGWWNSTRDTFDELLAEIGFNYGAEVGVCKGQHARAMLRRNKNLKLLLIDPWTPYNRLSKEKADARYKLCVKNLLPYEDRIKYMKMESMEAARKVKDESLDFVYIDGLHEFDPVMMDLIMWSKKVRPGGIVSGHDYYSFYQSGVIPAVNSYTRAHNINEWYVTRDKEATWFWIKS
jgi:hypothetical protein